MGYTIIKASGNAYALNRSMQNLTPVDGKYRLVIPDKVPGSDTGASFEYNRVTLEGICTLKSVNLKGGTQPYVYRLCTSTGTVITVGSRAGVSINEINGVITLDDNYDGLDVYVKLLPLQIQDHPNFYPTVATSIFERVIAAGDWVPVTPEPIIHTASLDSITYVIGNGTGWPQGIPASGATLNLKSATITYDGTTTTFGDATAINTMATDVSNINITAKIGSTSVLGSNPGLKLFTINSTNAIEDKDISIGIKFDYKGITVTSTVTIPQQANKLVSVTNPTGPQLVEVGTTLNASNYSATGTYSNGSTATVNATSIDPETVTESGAHTYTLTFAPEVTTTIQITGQLTTVSKAYISGVENPYPTKDANSYSWPLYVEVTHIKNGQEVVEDMTFTEYNELNEDKETYAAPVVTYANNGSHANSGLIDSLTGTMSFDFSNANYIYDFSRVLNISITCTSNSARSVTTTSSNGYLERYLSDDAHDFFDNNFTKVLLTTDNYLAVANNTFHISDEKSSIVNGTIMLSGSGTAYYLDKSKLALAGISTTDFYIGVSGYEGAIISANALSTSTTYSFRPKADVKLVRPDDNSRIVYAHHTPSNSNYTTYLITFDYKGDQQAVWHLYIPKNSEYSPITITSGLSVSPSSLPASGGTVTITPPTYSQTHGSETITEGANITYTLDGTTVTPSSNNTLLLSENLTNVERTRVLVATITLNDKVETSTTYITQAASASATFPAITSIVANTVNGNSYPYKQDNAAGTLVNTDNKLQIEYPLEVNVSGVGKMTYEVYKNTYPNSTYGNVTAKYKGPNGSGALYANTSYVDPTTGKYIIDLKADKCIVDRTGISKLTISNSNGSAVTLSSSIPTIHKLASSTVTNYFGQFTWNDLSFASTDNTSQYRLTSAHKQQLTGDYNYAVDLFKLASVSTTDANNKGRLRLLDTSDCYYLRINYDSGSLKYFDFAIVEVPNGGTLSPSTNTVYTGDTYGTLLGGYYTTGSASSNEGTTGFMYVKYTPTDPNNKVYYVDSLYSDDLAYMTVLIGQINQ